MDKLAKYNNGVKYLLVAVDVLSRFLRVEPMKTKSAADSTRAFKRMITKSIPEKICSDKGSEFKREFKQFCDSKNIDIYSTHSETKSAFAERNIRSLKNIIYKHLEKSWPYQYIKKLHDFVDIMNSRVNRVTGLAPKKVSDKDVPRLICLVSNKSTKQLRVPKFKAGDLVRVSKENLPFKKGYKQNFTDEIFQIEKIATLNPPTYNLLDSAKEKLLGKFYQPELILLKKKKFDEFEVHLLSTASLENFDDNTLAAFKNQLRQNISLEGDWRVALSEIIFPSEINNVYTDFFKLRSHYQKEGR